MTMNLDKGKDMMRRLCSVLSAPLPPATPIARRGDVLLDSACFQQEALLWRAAFAAIPDSRVALYFEDTFRFAAALWAVWSLGKTAVLPGDLTPAMVQALATNVHAIATDLADLSGPLAPVCASAEPA